MKKIINIIALAAIVVVACTKKTDIELPQAVDSFTISMGEVQTDNETKTELIWDGEKYNKLVWSAGDNIYITRYSVLNGSATNFEYATYETTDDEVTTATFTKKAESPEIPSGTGNYIVFYTSQNPVPEGLGCNAPRNNDDNNSYPMLFIPPTQNYVANGIDQGVMPMIGKGSSLNDIQLQVLGNIIRFNLYNSEAASTTIKITRIVLEGSDSVGEDMGAIGGTLAVHTVNYSSYGYLYGTYKGTYSSHTVTLNCGEGVTLSTTPIPFNIVISSHRGLSANANISDTSVSATIYYTVNGSAEQSYGPITLSNLTATKRSVFGKIYSFTAKDASAF